jgi:hypothetical protein
MEEPMADVPERYGRVKVSTLRRDFDRLRVAILAHDSEATEAAWEACERWVDYVFAKAMPAEAMVAAARREVRSGIYIASKTKHGPRWEKLRSEGVPVVSTWIDEYYPGATSDWADLWRRCTEEAASSAALILYREAGEELKGAWLEAGAALAHGVPVFAVGCEDFNVRHHAGITLCADLDTAIDLATALIPGARND